MTTHVLRIASTDGVIDSYDATYANARSGSGTLSVNTSNTQDFFGQEIVSSNYYCKEYFGEVDCSGLPTGETVDLAEFYWRVNTDSSVQDFTVEIREHDWGGGTLTTGDFVAGADLGSKTLWSSFNTSNILGSNSVMAFSSETALKTAVALRGNLRFIMASDRQRTNNAPANDTTDEQISIWTGNNSSANDPALGVETSDASYSGPTLDETTTGLITTGTTATVNRPGTQAECEDSLIVLFIVVDGDRTITMPSGFTAIHENVHNNGTAQMTQTACYKIGGASEPSTYSFTINTTTRACITASRISGHDATTPIEASGSDSISSGVAFSSPFDITTTQGNCLHLAFLGSDDGQDTGYIPGMTEVASFVSNAVSFGVHGVLCSTEVIDSGTLSLITVSDRTEQRALSSVAIAPGPTVQQHTATKGSMSFTGKTNSTYRRHGQDVADGSLSFSGQANSNYKYHRQDIADGTLNLSGLATTITKLSQYAVSPGSSAFTGQSASLSYKSKYVSTPGTLTVSGGETSLQKYHAQSIATGGLTVSGTLASLSRKKAMSVLKGLLTFTGQAVTLDTTDTVLVTYNVGPGHVTVNGRPTRYEPPPFITELHFPLTLPLTEDIERE